jgi:hypothetical protein
VSRSANVDARVSNFDGSNVDANAIVLYEHQSSLMPQVLNLYVRLLENIQVKFYMPLDFYITVHSGQQYIPTASPRRQTAYGTVTVPFDAENDADLNEQRL